MLPDEVREAVERIDFRLRGVWEPQADVHADFAVIKAHLLAREAEVERLRVGLTGNGCEVVYEAIDALSGETSGPWVRNIRAEQAESTTRQFAEAVRREAFKMPPPNEWTPRFVMLANEADFRITAHLSENSRVRT